MNERMEKLLKSYIPLSEPSFLLLSSLLDERHGYGIMQRVAEITSGRVSLGAGTVYTILYKMEQDGLIEVISEVDRRKLYKITPTGQKILTAECNRLQELAVIADFTKNCMDITEILM